MGIFDIDSGADNHLLNEQFHVFSKSPASVNTSLGVAANRSGHTVTSSDVWGQEIPAFFYADDMAIANTYNAKTNDLCRIGNSIAIYENGAWKVTYDAYTDIPDGQKFKNANGEEVIRFHKNRVAHLLNLKNNANDDGQQMTAKIQGWDETANGGKGAPYEYKETAPKFVSQFVTSTDKIVDGVPSKGYGPFVIDGTKSTTGDITKVLNEGTVDSEHYVANSFAGIIQYNRKRSEATYVHAFEYCGKTLSTAVSDIAELDEKISKISVTASGGVQAVSEAAKAAGFEIAAVEAEGITTPTLDLTTATITDGVFATTTGNKAKLVTAQDVENYVATNAKVSVNGQSATTITVAGTEASSSDIVHIKVTEDKTTTDKIGLKLTATIDEAVFDENGNLQQDGVVIATIAEKIANSAIKDAIETDNGAIQSAIDTAITGATLNSGTQGDNQIQTSTGDAANKLVTAAQVKEYVTENAQVTVTVGTSKKTSTGFEFAGSTGTDITVAPTMDANGKVTYSATLSKATVNASTGAITNGGLAVSATDAKTIADKAISTSLAATTTEGSIGKAISDVEGLVTGVSQTVADIQTDLASGATAQAIAAAKKAGDDAAAALDTAKGISLAQTGTLSGMFSVATTGTVGTGITGITIEDKGLATAIAAAKSGAEQTAASALSTAKNQSLAQTGTLSGMFTVQTAGTVGTGITGITISDTGLSAAITKAKTDAEATAAGALSTARGEIRTEISNAVSGLKTELTTGAGSLGEKVAALETATSTTLPAAIEQALEDAKSYADSKHTTSLDYVVLADNETLPTASAETLGKIYLVKEGNTANGETSIDAISGSYVEYMTRKIGDGESATYAWEKIGTTAADLSAYAKTNDVTTSIATAKSEAIAAAKTETTSQVTALANTHTADKTALEGSITTINNTIAAMDADLTVNGISVKQVDGKVTELSEALITASVPKDTTKVEGNIAYAGTTTITKHVIAPEKFQTATQMPSTLTSWVADLSNLTVGDNMFKGCAGLTVFVGDLSSLTSAVDMFNGCTLDEDSLEILSENLPTVTSGIIDIGASTKATPEMIATIKGKGWTVKSNGTAL